MKKKNADHVSVAAIQCSLYGTPKQNLDKVVGYIEKASKAGAQIVLPSELFETPYFCAEEKEAFFEWAKPFEGNPTLALLSKLAKKLSVAIPYSFFEKAGPAYYNSVAMINADGTVMGLYRKSHIPDGPGYEEKFYFRPGDTGFRVWATAYATVGVGICWDQWYPECARSMVLQGAELLFYPTAIGSEPHNTGLDTQGPWQRAMMGHSVSNCTPVIASNRVGKEKSQTFYGSSFATDVLGAKVKELNRKEEGLLVHTYSLSEIHATRASWGFFRDRRPELYETLLTADGETSCW